MLNSKESKAEALSAQKGDKNECFRESGEKIFGKLSSMTLTYEVMNQWKF